MAGFQDCNGNAADGCEVNVQTDVSHCNTCNHVCPGVANAAPTCTAGVCGFACNQGDRRMGGG